MTTLICLVGIYGGFVKLYTENHSIAERCMIGISMYIMGWWAFMP